MTHSTNLIWSTLTSHSFIYDRKYQQRPWHWWFGNDIGKPWIKLVIFWDIFIGPFDYDQRAYIDKRSNSGWLACQQPNISSSGQQVHGYQCQVILNLNQMPPPKMPPIIHYHLGIGHGQARRGLVQCHQLHSWTTKLLFVSISVPKGPNTVSNCCIVKLQYVNYAYR